MSERNQLLSRMRIAAPCSVGWESMEGDERVRFCRLCNLNVYNVAALTRAEAEALVARTEGRLCARLYRRADGTVLTKDCPTGLRAVRRRISRASAAAFAALVSLCAPAFGQQTQKQKLSCTGGGEITVQKKKPADMQRSGLFGVVEDPNGAVIAGAEVIVTDEATEKKLGVNTSDEGKFAFGKLPAGTYTVEVFSPGFDRLTVKHFEVGADGVSLSVHLVVLDPTMEVLVGVVADDSMIDMGSSEIKTVFKGRRLTDFPIPR